MFVNRMIGGMLILELVSGVCFGSVEGLSARSGEGTPSEQSEGNGTAGTVITSKRLTFDYKRYIAVFEEDVVVIDPEVEIRSDKLTVLFNNTNSVKSVTAVGNVRMRQENKTATCRKAVYIVETGKIVLLGKATLKRGRDSVTGDEITFWVDEDRMTCVPGRLIIFPQEGEGDGERPSGAGP